MIHTTRLLLFLTLPLVFISYSNWTLNKTVQLYEEGKYYEAETKCYKLLSRDKQDWRYNLLMGLIKENNEKGYGGNSYRYFVNCFSKNPERTTYKISHFTISYSEALYYCLQDIADYGKYKSDSQKQLPYGIGDGRTEKEQVDYLASLVKPVRQDPVYADVFAQYICVFYQWAKEYQEAEKWCDYLITLNHKKGLFQKARLYHRAGRTTKAKEAYLDYLAFYPDDARVMWLLSTLYAPYEYDSELNNLYYNKASGGQYSLSLKRRSAQLGYKLAIEWCKRYGIDY